MNCAEGELEFVAERYLAGRLEEAEARQFEEHYFECQRCFDQLEALRLIRQELRPAAKARSAYAMVGWIAAGLIVALGAGVTFWPRASAPSDARQTQPQPAPPNLVALARFDPPPYQPLRLRGAQDRGFRRAMEQYQRGDYGAAIATLEKFDTAQARFFLGVSYLLSNQTDSGLAALGRVIAAGDSPYLEEARFYSAKGFLQKSDAAGARKQLESVIAMKGDLAAQAGQLLQQLP
jgi:hypothetical protein